MVERKKEEIKKRLDVKKEIARTVDGRLKMKRSKKEAEDKKEKKEYEG